MECKLSTPRQRPGFKRFSSFALVRLLAPRAVCHLFARPAARGPMSASFDETKSCARGSLRAIKQVIRMKKGDCEKGTAQVTRAGTP
jgi:hypothetical protein